MGEKVIRLNNRDVGEGGRRGMRVEDEIKKRERERGKMLMGGVEM